MRRVFGVRKDKVPPPTIGEAADRVRQGLLFFHAFVMRAHSEHMPSPTGKCNRGLNYLTF